MATLDELREAYDLEDYHEDGAFSYDDMNAYHRAARALIAAQQQRIADLEKALEQCVFYADQEMEGMSLYLREHMIISALRKAAHDALNADAGGKGA